MREFFRPLKIGAKENNKHPTRGCGPVLEPAWRVPIRLTCSKYVLHCGMNIQKQAEYHVYQAVLQQNLQVVRDFWDLQTSETFRKEIIVRAFDGGCDNVFLFVADRCSDEEISRNIGYTFSIPHRFEYVLPRAHVAYNHSQALSWASEMGERSIVEALLPLSDTKDPQCKALFNALFSENYDIAEILFPVSNVEATMEQLSNCAYDSEGDIQWLQEKINAAQHQTLHKEVGHNGITRVKKL